MCRKACEYSRGAAYKFVIDLFKGVMNLWGVMNLYSQEPLAHLFSNILLFQKMGACNHPTKSMCFFSVFLSLCHGLRTSAWAEVTVGWSQELVGKLFDDVLSVVNCQSDETKTSHGNVCFNKNFVGKVFLVWFWMREEFEGCKKSHHFQLIYFITNELASNVPNHTWYPAA